MNSSQTAPKVSLFGVFKHFKYIKDDLNDTGNFMGDTFKDRLF